VVLSTVASSTAGGSGLETGEITVEFFADPEGVGMIDRSRTKLGEIERSSHSFDVKSVSGKSSSEVRGTILREINGQTQNLEVISDQHRFPKVGSAGPHVVVVTWNGTEISNPENSLWNEVFNSVHEPAPNWEACRELGVIEVWDSTHEITGSSLAVRLFLSNVDKWTAIFNVAPILLLEMDSNDPPNTRLVKPDSEEATYELPTNHHGKGDTRVELTFTDATPEHAYAIVYIQPTRMITLHQFNRILPGSGRPRINPGG
jgi:hypothetical protein